MKSYYEFVLKQHGYIEANLFPLQKLYLENEYEGSLIVSARTTSGKTLIAEFEISNFFHQMQDPGITLYVAPMISLVKEKLLEFAYFEGLNLTVTDNGYKLLQNDRAIFITTPEYMLELLITNKRILHKIGLVVIDEIHLIGDLTRGLQLELLISLLKLADIEKSMTFIGLSATLNNYEHIAEWLEGYTLFYPDRIIELDENFITYTGSTHHDKQLLELVEIKLIEGSRILLFESRRDYVELKAKQIANILEESDEEEWIEYLENAAEGNSKIFRDDDFDNALKSYLGKRVGFHHSLLTSRQKKFIENEFKTGNINVLVATTTLSLGVNLPADVVIISRPKIGRKDLEPLLYHQMIGRAGRYGLSQRGYSYMFLPSNDALKLEAKLNRLPDVTSSLSIATDVETLLDLLIWILGTDLCESEEDIKYLLDRTFYEFTLSKNAGNSELNKPEGMSDSMFKRLQISIPNLSLSQRLPELINELLNQGLITKRDEHITLSELGVWLSKSRLGVKIFILFYRFFMKDPPGKLINPSIETLYDFVAAGEWDLSFMPRTTEYDGYGRRYLQNEGILISKYQVNDRPLPTQLILACVLHQFINYIETDIEVVIGQIRSFVGLWEYLHTDMVGKLKRFLNTSTISLFPQDRISEVSNFLLMLQYGVTHEWVRLVRIPRIGRYIAKVIIDKYENPIKLSQITLEELSRLEYVGEKRAEEIKNVFSGKINKKLGIIEYFAENIYGGTSIDQSTILLLTKTEKANRVGTAFFISYNSKLVLITCHHVIKDSAEISFIIGISDQPVDHLETIILDVNDFHVNDDLDLAVLDMDKYLSNLIQLQNLNISQIQIYPLVFNNLEDGTILQSLTATTNISYVGYPNGLRDSINNLPLHSNSALSTHYANDYNGQPIALINNEISEGSSGSPVFYYLPDGHKVILGMLKNTFRDVSDKDSSKKYHLGAIIKMAAIQNMISEVIK